MINNVDVHQQSAKKRPLTKVRRHFVNRRAEDECNEETDVDPATHHLTENAVYMISSCLGLVEQNRKICIGSHFLNLNFQVGSNLVQDEPGIRAVTLNLSLNENSPLIPWEYTIRRLESYGDSDLASWASRIKMHYATYPKIMAKYFELLHSQDPQVSASLRKAKMYATLACKDVEKTYSYRKLLTFSNKESTEILSSSYSEGFLKEIGHTLESFVLWAKEHGLPTLFDTDCSAHIDVAKNFLECISLNGEPVQVGPRYKTFLYDKEGNKREVEGQYINIIEPTPEGLFMSGYFIMRKNFDGVENDDPEKVLLKNELSLSALPFNKEESKDQGMEQNKSSESKNEEMKEKMALEDM